jgi:hypothetical protein
VDLTITFSLVRCACGGERQAGQPCPHCGRDPEEVDEGLERRRTLVRALREREPDPPAAPLELDEAFAVVGAWLDRFFAAYEASGDGSLEEAAKRLRQSLTELDVLLARATGAGRLRPHHATWAVIDAVLTAYEDIRDAYLDALVAESVPEAEEAATRGQQAIDAAAASLDRFNSLKEVSGRFDEANVDDEYGDLLAGAEAVVELTGTPDMLELDRRGAELFARISGGAAQCPSGFGLQMHLLNLAVESGMDPARFWSVARRVYELLSKYEVALLGLFSDVAWRADLAGVSVEARDAGFEAAAVAAAAGSNRRLLIQSALRLAARQIERVARPLLATVLAVQDRKTYASERRREFNELLTRAAQAGLDDLLLGLDPKLRDADAHGAFAVEDEGVRLTGTRGKLESLSDEELIDATIAGTESVVAIYAGLVAALVTAGVQVEDLEAVVAAKVGDADKVKFVLLLNGWHEVDVKIADGQVTARGHREVPSVLALLAAVMAIVPEGSETLTLIASDDSGIHETTGPIAPWLRWSDLTDAPEKEIAFTIAAMASTIDGTPILTRAHSEKLYAHRALEALSPAVPAETALPTLRALVNAARALESDRLATVIASALRLRQDVATGGPQPIRRVEGVLDSLNRWLLVDVPQMRSSW